MYEEQRKGRAKGSISGSSSVLAAHYWFLMIVSVEISRSAAGLVRRLPARTADIGHRHSGYGLRRTRPLALSGYDYYAPYVRYEG